MVRVRREGAILAVGPLAPLRPRRGWRVLQGDRSNVSSRWAAHPKVIR